MQENPNRKIGREARPGDEQRCRQDAHCCQVEVIPTEAVVAAG
jgi:hypothetical protein